MRKEFAKRMAILAKLSNFELAEEILNLYWHYMSDLPQMMILEALEEAILDTGSKNMFPSAKRLRSYVDVVLSVDDRADQVTRNIVRAMVKFGRYDPVEARSNLSEEEWEVIGRCGGWEKVDEDDRVMDPAHFHAQMKKTAISTLRSLEKETLDAKRLALNDGGSGPGDSIAPHVPQLGGLKKASIKRELPLSAGAKGLGRVRRTPQD